MSQLQYSFNAREISLLSDLVEELSSDAKDVVRSIVCSGSAASVHLSEDETLILGDALSKVLVDRGFNESYELTSEGNQIEGLIYKVALEGH